MTFPRKEKTAAEEVQGETADGGRVQKAFEGCMTFPRKESMTFPRKEKTAA